MSSADWQFVWFTAGMAGLSTLLILPVGLGMAWLLAKRSWPGKVIVETFLSLPLVLPPVATGLVLLELFGRRGFFGRWLHEQLGFDVVFTWRAVVLALAVMSFPLLLRSVRMAFEGVNPRLEQMARVLGAGEWRVFWTVTFPLAWRGVVGGSLLAYARALGEFGATILVAGNIPGRTTTLSVAIYQDVQLGDDGHAWVLAAVSAGLAFLALLASEWLIRRQRS
ncbi:MAG: molybdate ABC transporter permease subunit [Verrucomicrobiota bacterium]